MKILRACLATASLVILASAIAAGAESQKDYTREARINTYFREGNENVGALDCDIRIHKRDVSVELKRAVKARDHAVFQIVQRFGEGFQRFRLGRGTSSALFLPLSSGPVTSWM